MSDTADITRRVEYLPPYTDEHGTIWYPVQHALGGIVSSLTPESQKIWQDYADKQSARLTAMGRRL